MDYKLLFEEEAKKRKDLLQEMESLKQEVLTKEDAIAKFNDHLTDMLEKEIKRKTEELTASYNAKSLFLATMSHEIRTPLTSILGYAENLKENIRNQKNKDIVEYILKNGNHLLELINDILDFSKIEQKQLNLEKISFNVPKVLEEIKDILILQATKKGIEFKIEYEYPIPSNIVSDITRVKQVIINLCSNAIKFTEKGEVRVKVFFKNNKLSFQVIDTGIGISDEKIQSLFDPFVQADLSTTRNYGGTGLGLTISKKLAELLDGDITVESTLGKGSQFTFYLNLDEVSIENIIKNDEELEKSVIDKNEKSFIIPRLSGTILVVDDYPDNLSLFKLFIDRTGADVDFAEDGEQAVEKALVNAYDLILMDIRMPKMDGHEAVQVLRAAGCSIPIVALTANVMKEEISMYLDAGFDAFLSKPIIKNVFYKTIAKFLPENTHQKLLSNEVEDTEEYKKLVEEFLKSLPERMIKMQQARFDDNWPEVRKLAHAIKGMGGAFGFPDLTEVAKNVELSIKNNKLVEADIFYTSMVELVDELLKGDK